MQKGLNSMILTLLKYSALFKPHSDGSGGCGVAIARGLSRRPTGGLHCTVYVRTIKGSIWEVECTLVPTRRCGFTFCKLLKRWKERKREHERPYQCRLDETCINRTAEHLVSFIWFLSILPKMNCSNCACVIDSVTRLGDLLHFGQPFKAFGNK